ncbi:hypothetical protein Pcinc_029274 [Petrolisthes cinctipes]|uniref:Uncharacterized protein n=1 Tax=Petrolisthes cinctipes TaxID=88211 RepID=A0AAE1F170_PETCI|nr:hypothetical protein Pcinc_029274 [Petrolisthes cinctipes]
MEQRQNDIFNLQPESHIIKSEEYETGEIVMEEGENEQSVMELKGDQKQVILMVERENQEIQKENESMMEVDGGEGGGGGQQQLEIKMEVEDIKYPVVVVGEVKEEVIKEGEEKVDAPVDVNVINKSKEELKKMHQVTLTQTPHGPSAPDSLGTCYCCSSSSSVPDQDAAKKPSGVQQGTKGSKFIRMKELHKLLFYLVYGYQGQEGLDQEETWASVKMCEPEATQGIQCDSHHPTIYCSELSWRMFIPPLPKHMNRETGWVLVCDVLLRLPLCVFVELVNIPHVPTEVDHLLQHPIKRNLLVKDLPPRLRQGLLEGRRYVSQITDLINRLCYVGVLQYGHRIKVDKEWAFIFVNRQGSLLDTTSSRPGYHMTPDDQIYPRYEYYFSCLEEVVRYWDDMQAICKNTILGARSCRQGNITIKKMEQEPRLMETLTSRNTSEAPDRDRGLIPGDGRGAAGLHSTMFAHMKRNWLPTITTTTTTTKITTPSQSTTCSAPSQHNLLPTTTTSITTTTPSNLEKTEDTEMVIDQPSSLKRKRSHSPESEVPLSTTQGDQNNQPTTSSQPEEKKKKKLTRKNSYDEKDKEALSKMKTLRVHWSSTEDSFLLLCKVACCFLYPNQQCQVPSTLLRDLLHEKYPEGRDKTSRACVRRVRYMMQNSVTRERVSIFLAEVKQDSSCVAQFKLPENPSGKRKTVDVCKVFRSLMHQLVEKFASSEKQQQESQKRRVVDLPDTMEEFEERFTLIEPPSSIHGELEWPVVMSEQDQLCFDAHKVICEALTAEYLKSTDIDHIKLSLEQIPHQVVKNTVSLMKKNRMVCDKKYQQRSHTWLPFSLSRYRLSEFYIKKTGLNLSAQTNAGDSKLLSQLLENQEDELMPMEVRVEDGDFDSFLTFVEFMAAGKLTIDIEIPEQVLTIRGQDGGIDTPDLQEGKDTQMDEGESVKGKKRQTDRKSQLSSSRLGNLMNTNQVVSNATDRAKILSARGFVDINPFKVTCRQKSQPPPPPPPPPQQQDQSVNRSEHKTTPHQHQVNASSESSTTSTHQHQIVDRSESQTTPQEHQTVNRSESQTTPQEHLIVNRSESQTTPQEHQIVNCNQNRCSPKQRVMSRGDNSLRNTPSLPVTKMRLPSMRNRDLTLASCKSIVEVLEEWSLEGKSQDMRDTARDIYHYISSLREKGASITQLKEKFRDGTYSVKSVVNALVDARVLVKVALIDSHWVATQYTKQWFDTKETVRKDNKSAASSKKIDRSGSKKSSSSRSKSRPKGEPNKAAEAAAGRKKAG